MHKLRVCCRPHYVVWVIYVDFGCGEEWVPRLRDASGVLSCRWIKVSFKALG